MSEVQYADFMSGFRSMVGYQIAEVEVGRSIITLELGPQHMNRTGITHGGVILTMIDAAIGYAGCYCTVPGNIRKAATINLSTSFLRPSKTGRINAHGRIRPGGRRIFFGAVEVFDEAGHMIAAGEGTYKYHRGSEKPEGVKPAPGERSGIDRN